MRQCSGNIPQDFCFCPSLVVKPICRFMESLPARINTMIIFSVIFIPLTSRVSMSLASQQMMTTSKRAEMLVVTARTNQSRRRCRQKIRKRNKEIVSSSDYQFTSVLQLVELCAITSM